MSQASPLRAPDAASMPPRPHDATYWVIPGRFLAGEYPGAIAEAEARHRLRGYLAARIDLFIDLTQAGEAGLTPYAGLLAEEARATGLAAEHRRMPIPDVSVTTPAHMREILDAIDEALAAGRGVYVHCWGGIGRTGTVVGCWLVRHGWPGEQAWCGCRPCSTPPARPATGTPRRLTRMTWCVPGPGAARPPRALSRACWAHRGGHWAHDRVLARGAHTVTDIVGGGRSRSPQAPGQRHLHGPVSPRASSSAGRSTSTRWALLRWYDEALCPPPGSV